MTDHMVFVLGDDAAERRRLARMVREATGLHAVSMAGGEAAVAWARAVRPAVIVTALRMRPLDGCALARQLKGCPDTRAIPIVAIGDQGPNDGAAARAAGCDAVIETPFEPAELAEVVRPCRAAARRDARHAAA
jgi:CheY-like chemotaxis protein